MLNDDELLAKVFEPELDSPPPLTPTTPNAPQVAESASETLTHYQNVAPEGGSTLIMESKANGEMSLKLAKSGENEIIKNAMEVCNISLSQCQSQPNDDYEPGNHESNYPTYEPAPANYEAISPAAQQQMPQAPLFDDINRREVLVYDRNHHEEYRESNDETVKLRPKQKI